MYKRQKLPNLFKPLKANGVNVTAVVYAPAFGFVYNGLDEMARAYYKAVSYTHLVGCRSLPAF